MCHATLNYRLSVKVKQFVFNVHNKMTMFAKYWHITHMPFAVIVLLQSFSLCSFKIAKSTDNSIVPLTHIIQLTLDYKMFHRASGKISLNEV